MPRGVAPACPDPLWPRVSAGGARLARPLLGRARWDFRSPRPNGAAAGRRPDLGSPHHGKNDRSEGDPGFQEAKTATSGPCSASRLPIPRPPPPAPPPVAACSRSLGVEPRDGVPRRTTRQELGLTSGGRCSWPDSRHLLGHKVVGCCTAVTRRAQLIARCFPHRPPPPPRSDLFCWLSARFQNAH